MRREKGFSLVELLIVVAIIGIITAIAIPSLMRARQAADAGSAVHSVRTIITAQRVYEVRNGVYSTLPGLVPDDILDPLLGAGFKHRYVFVVTLAPGGRQFSVTATPVENPSGMPHFYGDDTAVIRVNVGGPATATSPPVE